MKEYTAEAKQFYQSKLWKKIREQYILSVDGMCERCRQNGRYVPGKVVHHRIYLDAAKLRDPAIALDFRNLELLCQDCHNREHHAAEEEQRYAFDKDGMIIPASPPSSF